MAQTARPIAGRTVAVTGGARGIGRALAVALSAAGARVAIGDVDRAAVEATGAELGILALGLDVSDRGSYARFLDAVEAQLGPLDVLVNNAGVAPLGTFADEDDASTRRQLEVNLYGVILGCKLALARMLPRGGGHIVNVASSAGKVGVPGIATYAATKHGVVGLSETLAEELRGSGVRLSVVMPGPVETEMIAGTRRSRRLQVVAPDEVAAAIVEALGSGRFEVYVPRALAGTTRVANVLPQRARAGLLRLLQADRMYVEVDPQARAGYEARIRRQPERRTSARATAPSFTRGSADDAGATGRWSSWR